MCAVSRQQGVIHMNAQSRRSASTCVRAAACGGDGLIALEAAVRTCVFMDRRNMQRASSVYAMVAACLAVWIVL